MGVFYGTWVTPELTSTPIRNVALSPIRELICVSGLEPRALPWARGHAQSAL
jgi:hypothetical protein